MGGNNRKPDALKALEGNPGKRPLATSPEATGRPPRPSELSGPAGELWDEVVDELVRIGIARKLDRAALLAMCQLWTCYQAAIGEAMDDPLDKNKRCAAVAYYEKWAAASAKFGLNPADRDRIRTNLPADDNPLARWGVIG